MSEFLYILIAAIITFAAVWSFLRMMVTRHRRRKEPVKVLHYYRVYGNPIDYVAVTNYGTFRGHGPHWWDITTAERASELVTLTLEPHCKRVDWMVEDGGAQPPLWPTDQPETRKTKQ